MFRVYNIQAAYLTISNILVLLYFIHFKTLQCFGFKPVLCNIIFNGLFYVDHNVSVKISIFTLSFIL